MPTPRSNDALLLSPPPDETDIHTSTHRASCPSEELSRPHTPDQGSTQGQEPAPEPPIAELADANVEPTQQPSPPAEPEQSATEGADAMEACESPRKSMSVEDDGPVRETPDSPRGPSSPIQVEDTSDSDQRQPTRSPTAIGYVTTLPITSISPWPKIRFLPNSTTSYLRPGSQFRGTQQSDKQIYNVQVDLKHVDMCESYLCGYLRIQGLTDEHPTLTTFFEGEIIGTKYTFQTRHAEWGSNDKVDMQHWARFPAWRPLSRQAKRPDFSYRNFAQREFVFMRWKEQFLVPDHRVRNINGASFEGFYYICFNQLTGHISGIYYHARSEKFQQLELQRVEDHGCLGAIEFR